MEEDKIVENQDASLIYSLQSPEGIANDPSKGKIYLGGKEAAFDMKFILQNNITAVLTLSSSANPEYSQEDAITHLVIDIEDNTTYDIEKDFDKSYDFIEENLLLGNVLIHCEKGVSRSPTIAIAYIMRKEKKIFSVVLNLVRSKRKVISPNGGFYFHLGRYNNTLKEKYSEEYASHNLAKPTHDHYPNCKHQAKNQIDQDKSQ